jgi:hypothetical protein
MTKRERLEDLGIISEKLRHILEDNESLFDECTSKHTIDAFVEKYKDPEQLEELHDWIRFLEEKLWDAYALAKGDEEE